MNGRPRVLVVDDSAFARTVLSRVLRASGKLEVAGTARDGQDALEKIAELDPDLVTLDLTMPNVDGLGVLRALGNRARPRVVVVSISSVETEIGAEALLLGAVDLVTKPTAFASDRLTELGDELIAKLVAIGTGPDVVAEPPPVVPTRSPGRTSNIELVMLGTSTGGPQALTRVISALPATLAAPVAIVLHIPEGYTESLAARLDKISPLSVVEARDGLDLHRGMVILARGGSHLRIHRHGTVLRAEVARHPASSFMPSVDELFTSGTRAVGAGALGVVLTGMGDDGLIGARAIAEAGGSLITEAASTCVVYGMPRAVQQAGLGATSITLDQVAAEIARRV